MDVNHGPGRENLELLQVEVLNRHRGKVLQLQMPYLGDDVPAGYLLVPLPGLGPHRILGSGEPGAHVLPDGDALIVVDETPVDLGEGFGELFGYLSSRPSIDVLPLAVDLILGLPTTVLPLADGTLSLGPSHNSPFG